jgi:hypothetical protein
MSEEGLLVERVGDELKILRRSSGRARVVRLSLWGLGIALIAAGVYAKAFLEKKGEQAASIEAGPKPEAQQPSQPVAPPKVDPDARAAPLSVDRAGNEKSENIVGGAKEPSARTTDEMRIISSSRRPKMAGIHQELKIEGTFETTDDARVRAGVIDTRPGTPINQKIETADIKAGGRSEVEIGVVRQ